MLNNEFPVEHEFRNFQPPKKRLTLVEPYPNSQLREVYNRQSKLYDLQHGFFTLKSDERGRRLVVEHGVRSGDCVLDAGTGTGTTAMLAAQQAGLQGKVTAVDFSDGMLDVARQKTRQAGLDNRIDFQKADLLNLPFENESFDAVLSTYSTCPLGDPAAGALELYRVVKPGGRLAIVHSAHPANGLVKWLADGLEKVVWHFPRLSLGCRPISILPALQQAGAIMRFQKRIGLPLLPFLVFVMEKPVA